MNMLIEELQALGTDPWSWAVLGVLGIFTIYSIVLLFACPVSHNRATFTADEMAAASAMRDTPGPRFGLMMLGGAVVTVMGLFMIAEGITPKIALLALVSGIFVIQTEPARLVIQRHKAAAIAFHSSDPDRAESERDRLHSGHRVLAWTNVVLVVAIAAGLLAF